MIQFDHKSLFHLFKILATAYGTVHRHVRKPESIRMALAAIMLWHTARLTFKVGDIGLEMTLLALYCLCRAVRERALPPGWRAFKHIGVLVANVSVAVQLTRDGHLAEFVPGYVDGRVRGTICAAGICLVFYAVETFAESWQKTHVRRVLMSTGTVTLRTVEQSFPFPLHEGLRVLIMVAAKASSADLCSFAAELCTVNGRHVHMFVSRGYLACCELWLPAGEYVLYLRNLNPAAGPLLVSAEASCEEQVDGPGAPGGTDGPGGGSGNPSCAEMGAALDASALAQVGDAAEARAPHLCPTAARAEPKPGEGQSGWDEEPDELPVMVWRRWPRRKLDRGGR